MNEINPYEINRSKASSHPSSGIGVFTGTVLSIVNGKPNIKVEGLGASFNDVEYLGNTKTVQFKIGDKVLCTFVNQKTEELVILGPVNKKIDVFSTVVKFNTLIDEVESQLNAIRTSMDPPLGSISLQSFKQPIV